MDEAQVDALIDHERKALESLQKKIGAALGKSPDDEAKEALRAAMWGAMVAGNASPKVLQKIVDRGCALGLDAEVLVQIPGPAELEKLTDVDRVGL